METNYEKAGYCLEYLQSLRPEISKLASESRLDLGWMIDRLCTFSYESDFSRLRNSYPVNENWNQLLTIYHNIISRGIPTYPTFQIEEFLISEASRVIPIQKSSDEQIVAFRDQTTGALREKWLNFLVKAHASIDYRFNELPRNVESDEEKAFLEYLSAELGASVFQVVECQRPFETMAKASDMRQCYGQRVDFSLETKDKRIVVEIDGEQHLEEKHMRLDKQRQGILEKNGWDVTRIPASKVRQKQINEPLEAFKKYFSEDPLLITAKESFDQPINSEEIGRAALLLVLVPIAIARIQWALSWAFMKGKLNLDQPTIKIAIVEEDVPCAYLAIWDFIKSLNYLKSLAKSEFSLPRFELEILRGNDFDTFPDGLGSVPDDPCLHVHISRVDKIKDILQSGFDLVITVSSLHVGPKSPEPPLKYNNWITLNSVPSPRGARPRFDSASPINYQIQSGDVERLLFILQWIFRKKDFFEGQLQILERSLANKDVIGLLPTGGGKSLCYQLSALLQPGMTIIVDPIISLMHDQVDNLRQLQIDAISYLSSDQNVRERQEIINKMTNRFLLMLFISPERLQIQDFRDKLGELRVHTSVPYIVIDEAHCVSEWGHDFRPSYLRLADNARRLLHREHRPTVIGLTGTASWIVLSDMQREISIDEDEAVITPKTFDRKELEYDVVKCGSNEKISKIISKMLELPERFKTSKGSFFTNENAGIIFCPHIGGQHGIFEVAVEIREKLPDLIKEVGTYGGTKGENEVAENWKQVKIENQNAFKENRLQLMVATKAFGMGIDKPNIRYTIHYNIPTSLEAFYQEAGRAGRDRKKAVCIIIFSGELSHWRGLNTSDLPVEELTKMSNRISYKEQDDIARMLYLHEKGWLGIDAEVQNLMKLVNENAIPAIRDLPYEEKNRFFLPFKAELNSDDESRYVTEKALYRLSVLGLVSDYTIDYNAKQFEVEVVQHSDEFLKSALLDYFARYKREEYRNIASQRIELCKGQTVLEKCIRVMIEFVYEEIEKKRRQAIFQMAEVAEASLHGEPFRTQLLDYLEKSEFTKQLMDMAKETKPMEWVSIASQAEDIDTARHLLGGCRMALDSYPGHPGLLLLRAFSRIMIPKLPTNTAIDDFQSATRVLAREPEKEDTRKALVEFLRMIKQKRPSLIDNFCYVVLDQFPQRDMARIVLELAGSASESGIFALKILLELTLEKTRLVTTHILGGD